MLAVILLIPSAVSLIYKESIRGFAAAILISAALCVFCHFITRNKTIRMFSKEGFASVALSWIMLSLIGAVPFVVEGEIPSYIDALFETISGFTTTGASILKDVESMSRGLFVLAQLYTLDRRYGHTCSDDGGAADLRAVFYVYYARRGTGT